jgi:hypothetical protein
MKPLVKSVINIHLANAFPSQNGLEQENPLSPLHFNFGLE